MNCLTTWNNVENGNTVHSQYLLKIPSRQVLSHVKTLCFEQYVYSMITTFKTVSLYQTVHSSFILVSI